MSEKGFYKPLAYVICIVLERCREMRYRVQRKGTDITGTLISCLAFSPGDEVVCQVGDSDERGDNMVLCMDYKLHNELQGHTVSTDELAELNREQDVRLAEFRAKLDLKDQERERKKRIPGDDSGHHP